MHGKLDHGNIVQHGFWILNRETRRRHQQVPAELATGKRLLLDLRPARLAPSRFVVVRSGGGGYHRDEREI